MCIKAIRKILGGPESDRPAPRPSPPPPAPPPAPTGPSPAELVARERAQEIARLGEARRAAEQRELAARAAQTAALADAEAARREAQLAAAPTADSEASRKAQERRMRQLRAVGSGGTVNLLAPVDDSLVGFRRLLGS